MCTCPKLVIMSVWIGSGGDRGARYLGNSTKVSPKSSLRSTFTFLYFAKLVTAVLFTAKGFPT